MKVKLYGSNKNIIVKLTIKFKPILRSYVVAIQSQNSMRCIVVHISTSKYYETKSFISINVIRTKLWKFKHVLML